MTEDATIARIKASKVDAALLELAEIETSLGNGSVCTVIKQMMGLPTASKATLFDIIKGGL